jgi:cysteine-rich repeat protein
MRHLITAMLTAALCMVPSTHAIPVTGLTITRLRDISEYTYSVSFEAMNRTFAILANDRIGEVPVGSYNDSTDTTEWVNNTFTNVYHGVLSDNPVSQSVLTITSEYYEIFIVNKHIPEIDEIILFDGFINGSEIVHDDFEGDVDAILEEAIVNVEAVSGKSYYAVDFCPFGTDTEEVCVDASAQVFAVGCCIGDPATNVQSVCSTGNAAQKPVLLDIEGQYAHDGIKVSHTTAEAECSARGLRLCTTEELQQGKACDKGCGISGKYVWSSTQCNIEPAPAPPAPAPAPAPPPPPTHYWAKDFCPQGTDAKSICAPVESSYAVGCWTGTVMQSVCATGTGVYYPVLVDGGGVALHNGIATTHTMATQECAARSQQLCTAAQLEAGVACDRGCGTNSKYMWSSTACSVEPPPPPPPSPSSPQPALPPSKRLIGCPHVSQTYTIYAGVVADVGYYERTLLKLGSSANVAARIVAVMDAASLIYETYLGIKINLGRVILHTTPYANGVTVTPAGGPNFKPATPNMRETCPGAKAGVYTMPTRTGTMQVQFIKGIYKHLYEASTWAGKHAPLSTSGHYIDNWVILTHCHPPAGTVGLASIGTSMQKPTQVTFKLGGIDTNMMSVAEPTKFVTASYERECKSSSAVCAGGGVSINSLSGGEGDYTLICHEMGHNWNAQHSDSIESLMNRTSSAKFINETDTSICNYMQKYSYGMDPVDPACGNGVVEYPENCDDGNSISTDGCHQCKVTLGFSCTAPAWGASVCTPDMCGNGVVDYEAGEECDTGATSSCACQNCKLKATAQCNPADDNSVNKVCCSATECTETLSSVGCSVPKSPGSIYTWIGYCAKGKCLYGPGTTADNTGSDMRYAADCKPSSAEPCSEGARNISSNPSVCKRMTPTIVAGLDENSQWATKSVLEGARCKTAAGVDGICRNLVCQTAAPACGNGIVDAGEECDDSTACCSQCRFVKECSGGDCCTADCYHKTIRDSCGNGNGICGPGGKCLFKHQNFACEASSNAMFDPVRCNQWVASCDVVCAFTDDSCYKVGKWPDGTTCDLIGGVAGKCKAGVCVPRQF